MVAFVDTKYESDSGDIYPIRLSPKIAAVAGTAPSGETNRDISVKVSRSVREYGGKPRRVRAARTIGTAPDTARKYITIPVLRATDFVSATFANRATITVDGEDYTIVSQTEEDFN